MFAPSGDVVGLDYSGGVVLARDTGAVLENFNVSCTPQTQGAHFTDDHTLLVRCETGGVRVILPGGASGADDTAYSRPALPSAGFDYFGNPADGTTIGKLAVLGGFDGVRLYPASGGKELRELGRDGIQVLAAEPGRICAALTFGDQVQCWASQTIAPSTYDPAAIPPPDPNAPPVKPSGTYEGTIASTKGSSITLSTTGGPTPPVGATGKLSKFVESDMQTSFGNMHPTMWLEIADVEVTSAGKDKVVCTITAEHSGSVVNGKKVDQFTKDAQVHLAF